MLIFGPANGEHTALARGSGRVTRSTPDRSAGVLACLNRSHARRTGRAAPEILSPLKRREPHSPSPYPLPKGEGAWPVAANVEASRLVIARPILLPLLWGEGRVRGNVCRELKMASVKFHAAPNPSSGSGVLSPVLRCSKPARPPALHSAVNCPVCKRRLSSCGLDVAGLPKQDAA